MENSENKTLEDIRRERKEQQDAKMRPNNVMRTIFGIIMIIVYVGMGVLFLIDFFNWAQFSWGWTRYIVGIVLIIYGGWRAYRQFKGIDSSM
ncbi:MAG: hypothetical protein J6C67_03920 [Muribaculaceae bacterium]|nr:hypothetical protein [Muribaculaceae bacterium]